MKTALDSAAPECPCEREIPAYLQNELPARERAELERHIASCARCQASQAAYRHLLEQLAQAKPVRPTRDLVAAALSEIATWEAACARLRARVLAACAAGAVLTLALFAGWLAIQGRKPAPAPLLADARQQFIARAAEWLVSVQSADGSWEPATAGGQRTYAVGLTALAVLALLEHEDGLTQGPGGEAIQKGVAWLVSQQHSDGRFGPLLPDTPYNHALATLAVCRASRRCGKPSWNDSAAMALRYIRATQLASGGWGYGRSYEETANTSVTAWQLLALLEGKEAGHPDLETVIRKGLAWLDRVTDERGRVGYTRPGQFPHGHATLTAAAALCRLRSASERPSAAAPQTLEALRDALGEHPEVDYYRFFFLLRVLADSGNARGSEWAHRLRETLLTCQERSGPAAGSCAPLDPWSRAGGRVYATAMAVLAI